MGNRTAKFLSALFAGIIAGAPLSAVSQNAPATQSTQDSANANDDCLGSPKGATPQGQHWFYRVERGTKRQCWYLREEGAKTAQSTQTATTPKTEPSASRSVQDAHAELTSSQNAPAANTTASPPTQRRATQAPATQQSPIAATDSNAQGPAVATRWPDTTNAAPSSAQPTAPTTEVADADPTANAAVAPSPAPAPVALAAADVPVSKPTGSLQMLLLVVGGALALAGITGSLIYRFAGSRRRARTADGPRRRVNWDNWEPAPEERAPWRDVAASAPARAERPRAIDLGSALARVGKSDSERSGSERSDLAKSDLAKSDLAKSDLAKSDLARFGRPANRPSIIKAGQEQGSKIATMPADEPQKAFDAQKVFDVEEAETHAEDQREAVDDIHAADIDPDAEAIDIDAITAILERLAKEGPKLPPSSATGPADFSQSQQARSGARA